MGNAQRIIGICFEDEIRKSCMLIPNSWRIRLTDTNAGPRPADTLLITEQANYLIEIKFRQSDTFRLGYLEEHQILGLAKFEKTCKRNHGIVVFGAGGVNEVYALSIRDIAKLMLNEKRTSLNYTELNQRAVRIPQIENDLWDLRVLEAFNGSSNSE